MAKHGPLASELTSVPGVSQTGIEIRRGDKRVSGTVAHGYGRSAKDPQEHANRAKLYLKHLVNTIKAQPKPDLPKSEGSKEDMKKDNIGFPTLARSEFDKLDNLLKTDYWSNRLKQVRADKEAGRQKALEQHFGAKGQAVPEHLKNPQESVLDYSKMKMPTVSKQPASPKSPSQPVPSSPNKQVFDPDLSGKIDYKNPKLKASEDKPDHSKHCAALNKMIGCLSKVDPNTKLPGNLINKSKDK